jgi:hypothetical protein
VQIWCKVRAASPAWKLIEKVLLIYAFPWQMAHNNSFKKTSFGMSFASNECVPIDSFKICGYRIPVTSDEILACQDSGCRVNKHFEGLVKPTEPCKVFCFLRAVHKSSWERNRSIHSDKQIAMFWQASAIVRVQISYLTQHISISPKCCSSSLFRSTSWGAKKCIQLVHNANLS